MHKLYQGFLVQSVGEGASLTPYYDLLSMLTLAWRHRTGAVEIQLAALQSSCASNLKRAIRELRRWGGGYIQLGALLGARDLKHILVNLHNIDEPFSSRELLAFPELTALSNGRKSGVQRLFEEMIEATVGMQWSVLRTLTELCLESKRNDLILGHNILLMHGGLRGGRTRVLEPICLALPCAQGDAYERWLSMGWKTACERSIRTLKKVGI